MTSTATATATTTVQTGNQDGAGAGAGRTAADAQQPNGSPLDWVQQTIYASSQDARRQPWKKHFANTVVESRIDDGPDLVVVKKSKSKSKSNAAGCQSDDDDCCPFQIQGSSLAA